jgi:hypothetical protein
MSGRVKDTLKIIISLNEAQSTGILNLAGTGTGNGEDFHLSALAWSRGVSLAERPVPTLKKSERPLIQQEYSRPTNTIYYWSDTVTSSSSAEACPPPLRTCYT